MKLIFCVLLLFVFHYDEIDAYPNIDYKKPLELARVNDVYSLPPSANPRPSNNMEVAKYCRLQNVNNLLYVKQNYPSCVVKTTSTDNCLNAIRPKSIVKPTLCGRTPTGERYNFQHDICKLNNNNSDVLETLYLSLFEICYNIKENQPFYVEYSIASNSYNLVNLLDPNEYTNLFPDNINVRGKSIRLNNIANAYQQILNEQDPDQLIPQTLLPSTDFEPDYARGANLTWAVVRPQYRRLSGAWNSLNKIIWEKFHEPALKAKIYAGTAQNSVVEGAASTIQVNDGSEITVPYMWWKAVKTNDAFFIVIFYNIPGTYDQGTVGKLCIGDEKNLKTKEHCDYIRANLKNQNGIKIECCSLTTEISKEINLIAPINAELLNPLGGGGQSSKSPNSSTYTPPHLRKDVK